MERERGSERKEGRKQMGQSCLSQIFTLSDFHKSDDLAFVRLWCFTCRNQSPYTFHLSDCKSHSSERFIYRRTEETKRRKEGREEAKQCQADCQAMIRMHEYIIKSLNKDVGKAIVSKETLKMEAEMLFIV